MPGWLVELNGERKGRMHDLGDQALSIGRSDENDVVVANAQASRRHARVIWDGRAYLIEDLGSKSGTLVNGRAIQGATALAGGDEIVVPGLSLGFRESEETMVVSTRARASTLTFLFSDLRDFTRFVETHGDDAAAALVSDYRVIVRREVARAGGAEVKTEGDSFFVTFESARRALEAAIAILRDVELASPERPIRVGIGLHAGESVAQDANYIGSAINVAARITAHAAAGELLVTDIVRGLLRTSGLPPVEERTGLVLKGIDDAPRIFSVQWRGAETAS